MVIRMKHRFLPVILSALICLVFLCFIGCQSGDEEAIDIEEKKVIEIWHIWTTDTDANRLTFEAAMDKVKETYPEIDFKVEVRETETYKIRIKTSIAANSAPDIFFSWGAGFSEGFVDSGKVLNLDDYYSASVEKSLPRELLNYQSYNGSLYGLPYNQSYALLFVNEEILNRYELPLPTDYQSLLDISAVLSSKGITPIAAAGADQWPVMFHYATLALREIGPEDVESALTGETSFDQQGFIRAGYRLQEMVEAGTYGDDYLYLGYDEASEQFKDGEAAMFYMGSWATGGFTVETAVADDIKVMPFPPINGDYDDVFLGGSVDCFMINENTEDEQLAFDITKILTEELSRVGAASGMGLPLWNVDSFQLDRSEGQSEENYQLMSHLVDEILEVTAEQEGTVLWWDTFLGSKGNDCNELIIRMMTGEISPETYVVYMDELIQREE